MSAPAVALAAPPAWTRRRLPGGAWRYEHAFSGSVLIIGKGTSEGEITRRLADAEATIERLRAKRWRS